MTIALKQKKTDDNCAKQRKTDDNCAKAEENG